MKKKPVDLFFRQLSFDFDVLDDAIIEDPVVPEKKEWELQMFSLENIQEQMPQLKPGQDEDVYNAEIRFFKEKKKGILFTHQTGCGKTFSGLGIAKRFISMKLPHAIIITPTDKKCKDWISEGEYMGLNIYQLNDINDSHHGICTTTYANFYQNEEISKIHWNLVIYDECHYLQQNGKGEDTVYQERHRLIARLPSVKKQELRENLDFVLSKTKEELNDIIRKFSESTKVVFLSATPFAYVKSLKLADGCLWNIEESEEYYDDDDVTGYNKPDKYGKFMIENFGYRMRYNKLTIPETGVDINLMERNFHERQKEKGALYGRQIEVDKDYSRDFIQLHSSIGYKIDEGMEIFGSRYFQDNYKYLRAYYQKKYNALYNRQLLESIKSRLVIPRIKEHVSFGRKVVVFHDFNRAQPSHPFRFEVEEMLKPGTEDYFRFYTPLQEDIDRFHIEFSEYSNMDLSELHNPIDSLLEVFGEDQIAIYNGNVSKQKRLKLYNEFMNDDSEVNIFIGQRKACKEGISLHDMTGVKERVFIDLGLPTAPTDAIQGEGRIYRVGLMSNARYEYQTIQTNFERNVFADIISKRARTAENLALGNLARNMEIVFKEGYSNASEITPAETTGTGGKEADRNFNEISEFEKAKTYYWANQKRNSKTKSQEGYDYFATPDPLGYKIVEWLDLKSDQFVLEPSAGHGAIGRFLPGYTNNRYIEPSYELISKLKINAVGQFFNMAFEDYSIHNKFKKIAMNPPFGHGGILAAQHLEKALTKHLSRRDSDSRLIAIIPNGGRMQSYLDNLFAEVDVQRNFEITHEIILPSCTFERAGTNVYCKIIVVECKNEWKPKPPKETIDLTYCQTINDFFDEIEHLTL